MSESRAETIALPAACAERVATRVKKVVVVRSTSQALLHHVQWIVKRSGVIASNPRRCSPKSQQESCEMDKGAHYYSCDLQFHSPLDGRWKGKGNGSEAEREAYAASLVAACRSRGLHAIALTDHHEMTFVPYVRRAAADERRPGGDQLAPHERLVVFPGMELTLGVPCQALLLFDSDFPQDLFSLAANALAIPPAGGQGIARLDHIQSLAKLKDELDKHSYLRDRYIILPNVSDNSLCCARARPASTSRCPVWAVTLTGLLRSLATATRTSLPARRRNTDIAASRPSRHPTTALRFTPDFPA